MSDNYIALIDVTASPSEAKRLAPQIVECLVSEGLIESKRSHDCVLGGLGHAVGPACEKAFVPKKTEFKFYELVTSGVEVCSKRWVNEYGFTVFESAVCPRCRRKTGADLLTDIGEGVEKFYSSGKVPKLACPECGSKTPLHEWKMKPHLGFVNLAVVFWNWPDFDARGWKLDVPELLSAKLRRPLTATYGHV